MKLIHYSALLLILSGLQLHSKEIKLPPMKDRVIPEAARTTVIDVAKKLILRESQDIDTALNFDETRNPFVFEEEEEIVVKETAEVEETVAAPVVYGDDSILKAVAVSFSPQVQGTLAKGNTNYLQIKGGGLIKPGSTFPVKLPELNGETHTVSISAVDSNSYTLKLNETELKVPLINASTGGARRFQPK